MKTAPCASVRLDPELLDAAEGVLQEGETVSGLIKASVRKTVVRRRTQIEFIARGLASRDEARRTGIYFAADDIHAELARKLAEARAALLK